MTRRQPGFLIAVAILALSAVGLNGATEWLHLHFKKQPVEPARPLADIPAHLGPWVQVSKDEPLAHDVQDTLGTDRYVMRFYVDSRLVPPERLAEFDGKDSHERDGLVQRLQLEQPAAVVKCDVTYYTGMVDTVAHIPERCYEADGYLPSSTETVALTAGPSFAGNDGGHAVEASFLNFEDQTGAARVTKRVAYFFRVDGQWESDSLGVRRRLQDLRSTHGFYSKVELMMQLGDRDQCVARLSDFVTAALPQIDKCYPDWATVEGKR